MFAISDNELQQLPDLGKTIKCPTCGKEHPVEIATDKDGTPSHLQYYQCGKKTYLAGIIGKQLKF